MKKRISMLLACAMMLALVSCGGNGSNGGSSNGGSGSGSGAVSGSGSGAVSGSGSGSGGNTASEYHIGIITGSVSQSEDDRRGAEAFQAKYG